MRRTIVVLAGALVLGTIPASVLASGLELRVGRFFPQASSSLFTDVAGLYYYQDRELKRSDWDGWTGGIEWNVRVATNLELGLHLDGYERSLHTSSRDVVYESGREVVQTLELNVVPLGVSLRIMPDVGRGSIAPYLAVGGDLVFWRYEEFGEFVDYESYDPWDDSYAVFDDAFLSEGTTLGAHVAGGIRFPVNDDLSLVAEGRYQWAKDDMGEDFRGLEVDLSGASATIGLRIQF
jgi:opacity protein-like surface antigen